MSTTLLILCVLAPIGGIDVVYFHLYRFRLYRRADSTAEEVTHIFRQVVFVTAVVLLARGVATPAADHAILFLLAFDLANSGIDVLLEPRSRAALGGLPAAEYFVHYLGTFGTGLATATYLHERRHLPLAPAHGLLAWQSLSIVVIGGGILLLELTLFLRALRARRAAAA